jgi:hypothetical protein
MADDDRVVQLEETVDELMREVDRYRTATEDALQQLDWCIGYFVGTNKRSIARSLGANRAHIRSNLLERAEQPLPTVPDAEDGGGSTSSGK